MSFEYKKKSIVLDLIYGVCLFLFTIGLTYFILKNLFLEWEMYSFGKVLFSVLVVIIFWMLTLLFLGIALIRKQYYHLNLTTSIEVDPMRCQLIITDLKTYTKTVYPFAAVKHIEFYYSWNTHPFSTDLGYSKLYFEGNTPPLILTQNLFTQLHIENTLKATISKRTYRFANRI